MRLQRCSKCLKQQPAASLDRSGRCVRCKQEQASSSVIQPCQQQPVIIDDWCPNHSYSAIFDDAPSHDYSPVSDSSGGYGCDSGYDSGGSTCGGDW